VVLPDLTEVESRLWAAFPRGAWVDLRSGDPVEDDPAQSGRWGPDRVVRAEVISSLLLGACDMEPGYFPAVRLRGARVVGRVDVMGASVDCALVCEYCSFTGPLRFVEASARTVRIVGSHLSSFNGARMRVEGILNLYESVVEEGLRLDRAKVVGEVSLRGARLGPNADGVALAADGLVVEGGMECNAGFVSDGTVLMRNGRIEGPLDFSDASITGSGSQALVADHAVVNGRLRAERLTTHGEFRLRNASVTGKLDLTGARLHNPGGIALGCGGLVIHGGIWCVDSFTASGEMRFVGAELRSVFCLAAATLDNPGGTALNLNRAILAQLDGTDLIVSSGMLGMMGTQIADSVVLSGAELGCEEDETALWIEGATIGGMLHLQRMRTAAEVRIRNTTVAGRVLLMGAWLESTDEVSLRFTRNEVGADVVCDELVAVGKVNFVDSRIGRHLDLDQVRLINPGGVALDARMLQAGEVSLLPGQPIQGTVILDHARIGLFRDDPSAWPDRLSMDGLSYEALHPPLPARRRLLWLARGLGGYQPQPYEQLAGHYTRTGQPAEARQVLYAKERRQRGTRPLLGRTWGVLQDVTIAYGYQPWRAVLSLAVLLTAGSIIYGVAPPPPLKAGEAPHFNPVIYSLDLLLPIVDLGQERAYNPAGTQQWLSYFLIAAGWILATTIAAGVARVLSRR
jgi:hypothetical protein